MCSLDSSISTLGVLEKVNSSPTQICLSKLGVWLGRFCFQVSLREAVLRNYCLNKVLTHFLAQAEHTLNTC